MKYQEIMKAHPQIASWLRDRPINTQRIFAVKVMDFSEAVCVSPEEWRKLDKFEARDLAWSYVEAFKKNQSARAATILNALKSWYRNLNGEQLPLDSGHGGKHQIHIQHKKASYEKIPSKAEMYRIIDMAGNLRDKAILEVLFCSGIRVNALFRLTYGMIQDQLTQDIIDLKITDSIDEKLRGHGIDFYYTFINGEAATTLRQYCEIYHKNSTADTPLFYTRNKKPVQQQWVWSIVKKCSKRAGFDPKSLWTHSLRKAFRKVVRQADLDDDVKEELMGHTIHGSRSAYFDRHDADLLRKDYQRLNFSREVPQSEVTKLQQQLSEERNKNTLHEDRIQRTEKTVLDMIKQIKELQVQLEKK